MSRIMGNHMWSRDLSVSIANMISVHMTKRSDHRKPATTLGKQNYITGQRQQSASLQDTDNRCTVKKQRFAPFGSLPLVKTGDHRGLNLLLRSIRMERKRTIGKPSFITMITLSGRDHGNSWTVFMGMPVGNGPRVENILQIIQLHLGKIYNPA